VKNVSHERFLWGGSCIRVDCKKDFFHILLYRLSHLLKWVTFKRSLKWGEVIQVCNFFNNYFMKLWVFVIPNNFGRDDWNHLLFHFEILVVILTTLFWIFQHVGKGTNVLCTWRSLQDVGGGGGPNFMKWLVVIILLMVNASCILNNCARVLAQLYLKICTILFNYYLIK
jgi:hypothetical protein